MILSDIMRGVTKVTSVIGIAPRINAPQVGSAVEYLIFSTTESFLKSQLILLLTINIAEASSLFYMNDFKSGLLNSSVSLTANVADMLKWGIVPKYSMTRTPYI